MSQAQDQFDLVGFVKKAFEATMDPYAAYPQFDGVVVNKGNVIPAHAKVLKQAGYVINTVKSTGDVAGNLVVSIRDIETDESIVIYTNPSKIDLLGEDVRNQFEIDYVEDDIHLEDEPVEDTKAKKGFFARVFGA